MITLYVLTHGCIDVSIHTVGTMYLIPFYTVKSTKAVSGDMRIL